MKIGILSRKESLYSTTRLKEADIQRGHEVHIIDPLRCYMNITSHHPAIHYKGDALFHVAGFEDSVAVSESLDDFKEEISESTPSATDRQGPIQQRL